MGPKAASALSARWEAGGQITTGALGRGRRVRASRSKKTEAKRARKSRQPGARCEDSGEESSAEIQGVDLETSEPASASQPNAGAKIPYTQPEQEDENRKRGRVKVLGRTAVTSRRSLDSIIAAEPKDLAQAVIDTGFLKPNPAQFCGKPPGLFWKREICHVSGGARAIGRVEPCCSMILIFLPANFPCALLRQGCGTTCPNLT